MTRPGAGRWCTTSLSTGSLVLASLAAAGCSPGDLPRPSPHYFLGSPYVSGGIWFYPHEAYDLDESGLATIIGDDHPPLTSDGEAFDPAALAGAHPTLQLPVIARVTNLENGRQVTVRLNDRGTGDPHRLVALTRRTAVLLGSAGLSVLGLGAMGALGNGSTVIRVRLQVLPAESRAAAESLPDAPRLAMTAAPREAVLAARLPPPGMPAAGMTRPGLQPGSMSDASGSGAAALPPLSGAPAEGAPADTPPLRLPERVLQTTVQPTRLMVHLDTFSELQFAAVQQARMHEAGARIISLTEGHVHQFRVEIGPLQDVTNADSVLDLAFKNGIPDARIVIN